MYVIAMLYDVLYSFLLKIKTATCYTANKFHGPVQFVFTLL